MSTVESFSRSDIESELKEIKILVEKNLEGCTLEWIFTSAEKLMLEIRTVNYSGSLLIRKTPLFHLGNIAKSCKKYDEIFVSPLTSESISFIVPLDYIIIGTIFEIFHTHLEGHNT